jgi:predicted secreted protein
VIDLDAVRRLCDEATPGPWRAEPGSSGQQADGRPWPSTYVQPIDGNGVRQGSRFKVPTEADAAFIAAARELVPQLAAEVERLQAELKAMRYDRDWVVAEADDDVRARYFALKVAEEADGLSRHRREANRG